jgi:hypothetical protein
MDTAAWKILVQFMKCYCRVPKVGFDVKSLPEGKLGLWLFRETINFELYLRLILSPFYHLNKEEKSHGNIMQRKTLRKVLWIH